MKNSILYTNELRYKNWNDFNFESIRVATLPEIIDPENYENCFIFRDALLKAVGDYSEKKVLKLILITPDFKSNPNFYSIAYLENKEVLTVTLQQTEIFSIWYNSIIEEEDKNTPQLFKFSKQSYSYSAINNALHEQIFIHTGDFISNEIPNAFIAEELAKEKADFLNPFINLEVQYDIESIKQNFEKLVAKNSWKVIPPTDNQQIYEEFKAIAGFPFPQLLKDFLSLHNGVENTSFLNAESIFNEWKEWHAIYKDWTQEELLDTYSENEGKTLLMYTTPYWIPFFDLNDGNFIALDFAPTEKGKPGQVIQFGADQEIGYQITESLDAFLAELYENEDEFLIE